MKSQKGFTLVELLVVIAIIGILSTVAVVALSSARQKARDVKRAADIKEIQTALELYNNDRDGYPVADTAVALGTGSQKSLCTGGFKSACDPSDTVYMGIVPAAPTPYDGSCASTDNVYTYLAPGGGNYTITFCLGEGVGYLGQGVHTADPSGIQ
jgi:prepilin-type N-terminal cleavage/methylation domain-containing protein